MSDVGAQGIFGNLLFPFWIPLEDRVICLLGVVILKLNVERAVSFCITREDHHAACDLI
jgi:hypothetical protein